MPGPQELFVVAVVALLVFGPDRLPELARNAAKLIARLRAETDRGVGELKRAAQAEGLDREWREVSRELREVGDQLREPLDQMRDPLGSARGPRSDRTQPRGTHRSRTPGIGAAAGWRADDDPPPVDVEAT